MKKILLAVLVICTGCGSHFKDCVREIPKGEKLVFPLDKYKLYTLKLIQKKSELEHPVFHTQQDEMERGDLIWEELYLLLNKKDKTALYLTTFSHKYIFEGGVYNREENDSLIFIDESDFLMVGTYNDKVLTFKNPRHEKGLDEINLFYEEEGDEITVTKVSDPGNKSRLISVDSIYSDMLVYKNDNRKFVYGYKNEKNNYDSIVPVDKLYLGKKYLYIDGNKGTASFKLRARRLNCDRNLSFPKLRN